MRKNLNILKDKGKKKNLKLTTVVGKAILFGFGVKFL